METTSLRLPELLTHYGIVSNMPVSPLEHFKYYYSQYGIAVL